jgi:antitoxin component YwqK of YwqJK toxin-antitoxin module
MKILFLSLPILLILNCNSPKNSNPIANSVHSDSIRVDTTYYQNKKIYELIGMKGNKRNGVYLSYMLEGDTFISGQYINGLRTGQWLLKHFNSAINDSDNPLSGFGYTSDYFIAPSRIYLEFQHDSTKTIEQFSWYIENPKQIMTKDSIAYGDDTINYSKSWHTNGLHSQICKTINGGLAHDTTWEWREDGTLYHMDVYDHGTMIFSRDYDKTGTKVIKEKKGNK